MDINLVSIDVAKSVFKIAGLDVHGKIAYNRQKVTKIGPGTAPAYISHITAFDGTVLYFIADDGLHGEELWRSDGTESGTGMVMDINPSGDGMSNVNSKIVVAADQVYFSATDGVHGFELWQTDGTAAGTRMVDDINPSGNASPDNLSLIEDYLLFTTYHPDHGTELWAIEFPLFADGFED